MPCLSKPWKRADGFGGRLIPPLATSFDNRVSMTGFMEISAIGSLASIGVHWSRLAPLVPVAPRSGGRCLASVRAGGAAASLLARRRQSSQRPWFVHSSAFGRRLVFISWSGRRFISIRPLFGSILSSSLLLSLSLSPPSTLSPLPSPSLPPSLPHTHTQTPSRKHQSLFISNSVKT